MRDRLLTLLVVPFLILPLVVIAAGGDLGLLWYELKALSGAAIVVTVYAQASPPVGASPPIDLAARAAVPIITQWGAISLSIIMALIGLWFLNARAARRSRRN